MPTPSRMASGSPRRRSQQRCDGVSARRTSSAKSGTRAIRRRRSAAWAAGNAATKSSTLWTTSAQACSWERATRRRRSSQVPTVMSGPRAANTAMNGLHTTASASPATAGRTMPAHDRGSGSGRAGGSAGTRNGAGDVGGRRRGGRLNGIRPAAAPNPARTAAGRSFTGVLHCRQVAPRRMTAWAGTRVGTVAAWPATAVPLREPRSPITSLLPARLTVTRAWRREIVGSSSTRSQSSDRPMTQVSLEGATRGVPDRRPPVTTSAARRPDRLPSFCGDWEGSCSHPGTISSSVPSQIGTDISGVSGPCQHPSMHRPSLARLPAWSTSPRSAATRSATV